MVIMTITMTIVRSKNKGARLLILIAGKNLQMIQTFLFVQGSGVLERSLETASVVRGRKEDDQS